MPSVSSKDGRKLEFPETLTGTATLVGPEGGRYDFDAELLRAFLREWAYRSVLADYAQGPKNLR